MSPARTVEPSSPKPFPINDLHIVGLGVNYPEKHSTPGFFKKFVERFYPMTPAMEKLLAINEKTGIDARACAVPDEDPVVYADATPRIDQQSKMFIEVGVPMAATAARRAVAEWGGDLSEITHVVAVSATTFTNPGYDFYLSQELGLPGHVERVCLTGVGCAGGLAGLRVAANIANGRTLMGLPARILVVALEIGTLTIRTELDVIDRTQEVRVPAILFADTSTAIVLSNGVGEREGVKPVYDLLAWHHKTLPESGEDISFHVYPDGWRATITHRVPLLTSTAVPPIYDEVMKMLPSLHPSEGELPAPADLDWAVHPGGAKVLLDVQKTMSVTPEHLRASWDIYRNHGNTSSATIFSVLNRLRQLGEGRDHIIGCAFGPGVSVETCVLKRCRYPAEEPLPAPVAESVPVAA